MKKGEVGSLITCNKVIHLKNLKIYFLNIKPS